MIKNKLTQILKVFMFFLAFLMELNCTMYATPTWQINNSKPGGVLEIRTEAPGEFDIFSSKFHGRKDYQNIIVTGQMNSIDFIWLELLSVTCNCSFDDCGCTSNCKFIDLSGVQIDTGIFPDNRFICHNCLEKFIFPNNTKKVGSNSLVRCPKLKEVVLPQDAVISKGSLLTPHIHILRTIQKMQRTSLIYNSVVSLINWIL